MRDNLKQTQQKKILTVVLIFAVLLSCLPGESFAMVNDWRVGDKAYFKNGRVLEGSDGQPYYNYHTSGRRYAYCIAPINGGTLIRGYCLERNMSNPMSGDTKYYAKTWDTAARIKDYSQALQTAVRTALLYGKQPQSNKKDLVRLLGPYGVDLDSCNMDDWWLATQTIIWEFTDGYRKNLSSIPEDLGQVKNGKVVLGTVNAGEGYDFHYGVLRGRPARHIYFAMLRAMKKHRVIPSFTGKTEKKAKGIFMEKVSEEDGGLWRSVNPAYGRAMSEEERTEARKKEDYYVLKDTAKCGQQLKVIRREKGQDKVLKAFSFIKKGDSGYILEYRGESLSDTVYHGKKNIPEATTDELLVWQNSPSQTPLQTIAIGGDDPVDFYFKLKEPGDAPEKGEPGEPKLPAFTFDTEKRDYNPGFDQSSGTSSTGMGDAPLDSEITLYIDGAAQDSRNLTVYGSTDGDPFVFTPWETVEELDFEEVPSYDEKGALQYTDYYWRGTKAVSTRETKVPQGRHPEAASEGGGRRDHGVITYYAHCRDDGPVEYKIDYEGPDGTGAALTEDADIDPENPQPMRDETGDFAYVNDNYRGQLQIIKTKDDLDPFTDKRNSDNGVKEYSTRSLWTVRLESGGWENCEYVRVVDEGTEDTGYGRFAHKYRVTRDSSGTPADRVNPLTVSEDGQIYLYDLPYGTYIVEEISADSQGYVLESFRITVSKDKQSISREVNNQAKRNRIKVIKTNAETGKTVRWDADRTAFQIRYMGRPDLADPSASPNYGKWLPNGSSYTDDDQDYVFYAGKNGEIELPYDLEYGIYEIQELVVPEGYFVGRYDEAGRGSFADMGEVKIVDHKGQSVRPPLQFLQAVQVRNAAGEKVEAFEGNPDTVCNTYTFSVLEQDPHVQGKDYTAYYAVLEMPNNPAKGKLEIIKEGRKLTGWKKDSSGIWSAVFGKAALKDARYEIYAAEDILQSDGVVPVKPYLSSDGSEIQLEPVSRDHADIDDAKEIRQKEFDGGVKLRRISDKGLIKDFGRANMTVTDYIVRASGGASYEDEFTVRDEERKLTATYRLRYHLNYARGGFNYTDVHLWKTTVSDDYTDKIDVTEPVLKNGEAEIGISTMNYDNGNRVRSNPLDTEQDMDRDEVTGIYRGYGTADITARPVAPAKAVQAVDPETGELLFEADGVTPVMTVPMEVVRPAGWEDAKDADGKFFYEDRYDKDGKLLPKSYIVTDGQRYRIFVQDGLLKRWISCDSEGNYYKSYTQEYSFTTAQHYAAEDGFSLQWDDEIFMTADTDHENRISLTEILDNSRGKARITESEAYSHETADGKTVFTGKPVEKAFAYFLTNDGIRTEMYLSGGLTHTKITVNQSQLFKFDRVLPEVAYRGEGIDWNGSLNPENSFYEKVFDENNYLKAQRHKPTQEMNQVYYTIDIVSDSAEYDRGFKVTYPDSGTAVPMVTDNGAGADLRFASVDDTMVYPLGKPVEIITTGDDGRAESGLLPLGDYWVREVSSAAGHINAGKWQKMTVTYENQYTPLLWDSVRFDNEAVSVRIDLEKLFEKAYGSGEYEPGSGAVFGIYTAEAIRGADAAGNQAAGQPAYRQEIPADTLVGRMAVTDGQASAAVKLPPGKYYIKEISAPQGFKTGHTKYYFDAVDILTADQMSFHYKDIGVRGSLTQSGEKTVTLDFDTLYRFTGAKVVIDGKTYPMNESCEEDHVKIDVLDGRTNVTVSAADGQKAVIKWENGAVMEISPKGQSYTAVLSGPKPTALETGPSDSENFTRTEEGGKTVIHYTPKVTGVSWLGEVNYTYVKPKEDASEEEKEKKTVLELTSATGISAVQAQVDYAYESAMIFCPLEKAEKILINGEPAADTAAPFMLSKKDQCVISFGDGTSFTAAFDGAGNFLMTAAGEADKRIDTECTLTVDGESRLPKGITLKNTAAKTYARNNTGAEVLNVTISGVKNDRLPQEPGTPTEPETPGPESPKGSLEIIKVCAETGKPLPGAAFEIWSAAKTDGETVPYVMIFKGKTGKDGRLTVTGLKPGVYFYRETAAPSGYTAEDEYCKVTLDREVLKKSITVRNEKTPAEEPVKGSLLIRKVCEADGRALQGAVFEILDENHKTVYEGTTGKDGILRVEDLPGGAYYYREVKAPKGYILDEETHPFYITENEETLKLTVFNEPELTKGVKEETPDGDIPKTGDKQNMAGYLMLLMMAAAGVRITMRKLK